MTPLGMGWARCRASSTKSTIASGSTPPLDIGALPSSKSSMPGRWSNSPPNSVHRQGCTPIHESKVVIRVENLSIDEREQILYNHIRLGTQPIEFKRKLK